MVASPRRQGGGEAAAEVEGHPNLGTACPATAGAEAEVVEPRGDAPVEEAAEAAEEVEVRRVDVRAEEVEAVEEAAVVQQPW